jgi:hypothetical protein
MKLRPVPSANSIRSCAFDSLDSTVSAAMDYLTVD